MSRVFSRSECRRAALRDVNTREGGALGGWALRTRTVGAGGRAGGRSQSARALAMARWLKALVALLLLTAAAAKKSAPAKHEPQIEEVTAKQLERVLEDKDFVAVFWCK